MHFVGLTASDSGTAFESLVVNLHPKSSDLLQADDTKTSRAF
jgi:hypothetical protein